MGLNGRGGGFRHSGDHNVYGRGSYGLPTSTVQLDGGNAGGLQHHLTDFLHQNPFLHTQADLVTSSSLNLSGSSAYNNLSMGFTETTESELDRSFAPFDVEVMPHVVDDQFNFPVGIVSTTAPSFGTIPCLGLGVPSLQQQQQQLQVVAAARESWVNAAAMVPTARGVKREGPVLYQANMQPRKKVETTARVVVGLDKCKRPCDQADHILRERQRRDDMTSKFTVLESLLPTGPKVNHRCLNSNSHGSHQIYRTWNPDRRNHFFASGHVR